MALIYIYFLQLFQKKSAKPPSCLLQPSPGHCRERDSRRQIWRTAGFPLSPSPGTGNGHGTFERSGGLAGRRQSSSGRLMLGCAVKPISTLGMKCAIRLTTQRILARKAAPENRRSIKSAAFDAGETICPVHFPVHRKLVKYGIGCTGKTARRQMRCGGVKIDFPGAIQGGTPYCVTTMLGQRCSMNPSPY